MYTYYTLQPSINIILVILKIWKIDYSGIQIRAVSQQKKQMTGLSDLLKNLNQGKMHFDGNKELKIKKAENILNGLLALPIVIGMVRVSRSR